MLSKELFKGGSAGGYKELSFKVSSDYHNGMPERVKVELLRIYILAPIHNYIFNISIILVSAFGV